MHQFANTETNTRIKLVLGDITKINCDAIVNATNSSLLGGSGVDGAIHKAAGAELMEECRVHNGCDPGEAKITGAYNLPCKKVIHTVGPIWVGGHKDEHSLLASCYRNSLEMASKNDIKTIAFPGISTGTYRFPEDQAVRIAINEVRRFLSRNPRPEQVIFVAFTEISFKLYQKILLNE